MYIAGRKFCDFYALFSYFIHIQDGCTFRDHVITPSSTHNSTTDTDKEVTPNQQVYSILCQLRNTVCAETLKTISNKNDNDNTSATSSVLKNDGTTSQQQAPNELCFLQNEVREPRLPPTSSGEVPISQRLHRDVSRTRSNESVQHSASISHGMATNTPVRHSHGQRSAGGAIARQASRDSQPQSHDLVEMEEDDERERPQVLVQPLHPRRGRHVCVYLSIAKVLWCYYYFFSSNVRIVVGTWCSTSNEAVPIRPTGGMDLGQPEV